MPEEVKGNDGPDPHRLTDEEILRGVNLDSDTEMEDREGEEDPLRYQLNLLCPPLLNRIFFKQPSLRQGI